MLTPEEIAHYHEHGYVVPSWRMPEDRLQAMRDAAELMQAANPQNADLHPALLEEGEPWPTFGKTEGMLAMVRQLIGEDVILWSSGIFGKPAHVGKATPWHQDGEYWPIRPLANCTAWVALDDSTPENGCLRVISGSHKAKTLMEHIRNDSQDLTLNQEIPAGAYDQSQACDLVLEAGQVSLHDVYMIHGSAPNRSGKRRRGLTFRYMPTTSHFDRDLAARQHAKLGGVDHTYRTLFLVNGCDVSGRNELVRRRPAA